MPKSPEGSPHNESYYTLEEAKRILIKKWEGLQEFNKKQSAEPLPSYEDMTDEEMEHDLFVREQADRFQRSPYEESIRDFWSNHVSPEHKSELVKQLIAENNIGLLKELSWYGGFDSLDEEARLRIEELKKST
jgi:hypothetical protein